MLDAMAPFLAAAMLWVLWAVTWVIAAAWSRRAAARPSFAAQLPYRVVTVAGAALLFDAGRIEPLGYGPFSPPLLVQWALVGFVAAGFAFTWWARLTLGSLWSSSVTRKEDHRIVQTGPYAFVRHPIYTGLMVSAFAIAIIRGTPIAGLGFALLTFGFWLKAKLEESFLRAELGPADYDAYAARTGMLLPFL